MAQVRAATSRVALAAALWTVNAAPGDAVDTLTVLLDVPAGWMPFKVYVESQSDFGYRRTDSLSAVPRAVGPASLVLDGGATATNQREITITAVAPWATQMRCAEQADFTGVAWQPFAATSQFVLSPGVGEKTVNAQFRNGLDPIGRAASARIELLSAP
jgi:hypothetical protein